MDKAVEPKYENLCKITTINLNGTVNDRMMIYTDASNKLRMDNTRVSFISATPNFFQVAALRINYFADSNSFKFYIDGVDAEASFNSGWDSDFSSASFPRIYRDLS